MLRAKSYFAVSSLDDAIIDLMEAEKLCKCGKMTAEIEALRKKIGRVYIAKTNYELLEVSRDAKHSEIVTSFNSLSLLHRVLLNEAETKADKRKLEFLFKRIENSFSILSDKTLRLKYDRLLEEQESRFKCSVM